MSRTLEEIGGYELDPLVVDSVDAIKISLSHFTSLVHYQNAESTINDSWQQLCDQFETAFPEDTIPIPLGMRDGVRSAGFGTLHDTRQQDLEALPVLLVLSQGDKLIPHDGSGEVQAGYDLLFAELLDWCVESRVKHGRDQSGTESKAAVQFQVAKVAHDYIEQFKPRSHTNGYHARLQRVIELAGLSYHPVRSRIRKLGGRVFERIVDSIDL